MNITSKYNIKRKFANFFGASGYFLNSIQWLWALLLYSSLITGLAQTMVNEPSTQPTNPSGVIDINSSIPLMIIATIVTIVMSVLTIYIMIKIPSTLIKSSKKVAQRAAEEATPIVLKLQNKKNTKKNQIKINPIVIVVIKILIVVAPIVLVFTSQFIEKQIFDFYISIYIGGLLACFSLLLFVFQYLVASILSVRTKDLW